MAVPEAAGSKGSVLIYISFTFLAFLCCFLPVQLVLGTEMVFASFFFLITLRRFGAALTALQVTAVHVAASVFLHEPLLSSLVNTVEIGAVFLLLRTRLRSVLPAAALFWGLLGIPLLLIIYYIRFGTLGAEIGLYTVTLLVSRLFNALMADLIWTYLPHLRKQAKAGGRTGVQLSRLLLHLTLFSVIGSSFLFMVNTGKNAQSNLEAELQEEAAGLTASLSKSYASWSPEQVRALKLHSLIQAGYFRELAVTASQLISDEGVLIGPRGEVVVTYGGSTHGAAADWMRRTEWRPLTPSLFEWRTPARLLDIPGNQWQRMAVVAEVPLPPFKLYMKMSTVQHKEEILGYYLSQSVNVIFTTLVIGVFALFIHRFVLGPTIRLAELTRDVPGRLKENRSIAWMPPSRISEIQTLLGNFQELTEQLSVMLRESKAQAYYDALTGLPNRRHFNEHLQELLGPEAETAGTTAVLFIDLDRFKQINDTLGHAVGDGLLQEVAARLTGMVGSRAFIARLGGDEFVIVVQDTNNAEVCEMSKKVLRGLAEAFQVGEHELFVAGSIGAALSPQDGSDPETVVKNADAAMYLAKEEGGNAYRFFSGQIAGSISENMRIEFDLRRAIERGELHLHYQPIVDAADDKVVGAEALLRWDHPELGPIPPLQFIGIAESSGLIGTLGEWVLREACGQGARWLAQGLPLFGIGVNLSPTQLTHNNVVDYIGKVLEETGFPPEYLNLEITEEVFSKKTERVIHDLTLLREMGVRVWVDDFGTGYSSLAMLSKLPVVGFKIDRAFIREMGQDLAIVKTILSLAKDKEWIVVAEGIEEEEQKGALLELECRFQQGFHYSRPMPPEELARLLESQQKKGGTA
ncbi:putative bifunctional diguanylate cyclase/phosphodiesterase [Paenibacillus mucilaginosus]|uniref:Probable signaling protein n=1 Tax=Paenibacillus mucilaginosus (strain KNP414) TaxID=1036673 RepID=F8FMF2_PAEMK|nr:EAL domain-containing protein [Paenibacillus mucilaginosus]AEI40035.1 probable signaling protein [Paenibacillus mucilaginosus KNP414]MCG7215646.1 EAL domain-containing protein [Paenibacillus mucilaginosus]WDM29280.1 EAL domain-containing protein [Paenibacillus mucilaginosus]